MGFDDLCSPGLVLGLGFSSSSGAGDNSQFKRDGPGNNINFNYKLSSSTTTKKKKPPPPAIIFKSEGCGYKEGVSSFEPSLTLSLSAGETNYNISTKDEKEEVVVVSHDYNNNNNKKVAVDVVVIGNNTTTTTYNDQFHIHHNSVDHNLYRQDSTGTSSFSNVSVKREREVLGGGGGGGGSSEEVEIERVISSRNISDEDDDGSNAGSRKKLRLTKAQSGLLEESFKQHSTLNPKQKQDLARELNLRPRQVEVWFQNRRARTKLKQTEVDCEFLKKCCETLTDENRRLQKEVQELKALKLAQPSPPPSFYMQLPAATLTMCPSCERIGGGGGAGGGGVNIINGENNNKKSNNSPFNIASKPHFYTPFTNQSAAC